MKMRKMGAMAMAALVCATSAPSLRAANLSPFFHHVLAEQKSDSIRRKPSEVWRNFSEFLRAGFVREYVESKGASMEPVENYVIVFRLGTYGGSRCKISDQPVLKRGVASLSPTSSMRDHAVVLVGKEVPDSLASQFSRLAGIVFVFQGSAVKTDKKGKKVVYPKIFINGATEVRSGRKEEIFIDASELDY